MNAGCWLTRRRAMPAPAAMATSGASSRMPASQQQRALALVAAARMHVAARLDCRSVRAAARSRPRRVMLLDRHDRIAAGRQHGAGHDLDAVVGRGERQRRIARGLRGLDAQAARPLRRCAEDERDAIHRHAIEGRLVALGVDVLAQHRAGALADGQRFDRQAGEVLRDLLFGLGGRQHDAPRDRCTWRAVTCVLGLEGTQLLVEAVGNAGQLVDRRVVLLRVHRRPSASSGPRSRGATLGERIVVLGLDAGEVRGHLGVVLIDQLLAGDHFLARCGVAIRCLARRARIGAVGEGRRWRCRPQRPGRAVTFSW